MTLFGGAVESLTAIEMHVHLEPEEDNVIDSAAKKYFGDSGAPRNHKGVAEYYRSRKIGFLDRMNNCYIGTLDSFAFQLLQQYVPKYESYDVLDDRRQAAILSREAKRIGLKGLTGKLYDSIEASIANVDVVENELIPLVSLDEPFKSMLAGFLETLEFYQLLTYGQQIALAVREIERSEVFEQVHSPLHHFATFESSRFPELPYHAFKPDAT